MNMEDSRLKEIFRAYDVRGEYPDVLNPEVMRKIGKAYATHLIRDKDLDDEEAVVMGRDARNSSRELSEAVSGGLNELGIHVEDQGTVPFGLVLYKSLVEGKEAAYITASHLPKGWNGIKFYHSNGIGWTEEENYHVRDLFMEEDFESRVSRGTWKKSNFRQKYIGDLLRKINVDNPIKVVLDCGNGTAGIIAPSLFAEAGFEIDVISEDPDGDFPNRDPGVKEENLSELKEKAKEKDLGIAYDGDSDRMVLVDDKGRVLDAGETSYVLLKWILKNKEGPVISNVEVSRLIEDIAREYNREVRRIRVGHTFLFKETLENNGCFGAESSGHYCIPFFLPLDDGISCSLFAAWVVSNLDKKLSEIVDDMPSYHRERDAFECPDSEKFDAVESLKNKYLGEFEKVNTTDGVRVDMEEGWVLVRASNTSPKIRVTVESESEIEAEKIKKRFSRDLEEEIKSLK